MCEDLIRSKRSAQGFTLYANWNGEFFLHSLCPENKGKMRNDSVKRLLALGFDSDLVEKCRKRDLNQTALKGMNKSALEKLGFVEDEIKLIQAKVNRPPIPEDNIQSIMEKSASVCAYCADGDATRPFQIHHIQEYHLSQDHAEENLLLICPNHHVAIHQQHLPAPEQHARKRSWESVVDIASIYHRLGIPFPFGAFEYIDYSIPGEVTEVFDFGPPKPSVCRQLVSDGFTANAVQILEARNGILLSGASGSGKSTMALGIAGKFLDHKVYRYIVADKSSIDIARDIFQFLGLSTQKIILVIDDANTKIESPQIESLFKAVNNERKIIVVVTENTMESDGNLALHLTNHMVYLSWATMRELVIGSLLEHEHQVITYLKQHNVDEYRGAPIGYSIFHFSLRRALENYANETNNVWQFIFLLTSGIQRFDGLQERLFHPDRMDLLVLFISIRQIARFEEGTDLKTIEWFYGWHSQLKKQPIPSPEWLSDCLSKLEKNRILQPKRDRFNTIHRQFALSFLDICYSKNIKDTSEILDLYFQDFKHVREILILWTWLTNSLTREYIRKWLNGLDMPAWESLADEAAQESFFALAVLCDQLHMRSPAHNPVLQKILINKASIIAIYVNSSSEHSLFYLAKISTAIRYHCPTLWAELLPKIDRTNFANLFKNTQPGFYTELHSLFYAIEQEESIWILQLSETFSLDDFFAKAKRIDKGDIDELCKLIYLQRRYFSDIKRSTFGKYIDIFHALLKDCHLEAIHYSSIESGLSEIYAYPKMIDYIFTALSPLTLARELEKATPNSWARLLSLSHLSTFGKTTVIQDFLNHLDGMALGRNIEQFYQDHLYEFRTLIYQLSYAHQEKKTEFANIIFPLMDHLLETQPAHHEINDLLHASYTLAPSLYDQLFHIHGIEIQALHPRLESENYDELINDIALLEQTGEDYDMTRYKIKLPS